MSVSIDVVSELVVRLVHDDIREENIQREENLLNCFAPDADVEKFSLLRFEEEYDAVNGTLKCQSFDKKREQNDVWKNC